MEGEDLPGYDWDEWGPIREEPECLACDDRGLGEDGEPCECTIPRVSLYHRDRHGHGMGYYTSDGPPF